jgi:hypothetical protein
MKLQESAKKKKGLKLALDMFQTERYALLCISNIQ